MVISPSSSSEPMIAPSSSSESAGGSGAVGGIKGFESPKGGSAEGGFESPETDVSSRGGFESPGDAGLSGLRVRCLFLRALELLRR